MTYKGTHVRRKFVFLWKVSVESVLNPSCLWMEWQSYGTEFRFALLFHFFESVLLLCGSCKSCFSSFREPHCAFWRWSANRRNHEQQSILLTKRTWPQVTQARAASFVTSTRVGQTADVRTWMEERAPCCRWRTSVALDVAHWTARYTVSLFFFGNMSVSWISNKGVRPCASCCGNAALLSWLLFRSNSGLAMRRNMLPRVSWYYCDSNFLDRHWQALFLFCLLCTCLLMKAFNAILFELITDELVSEIRKRAQSTPSWITKFFFGTKNECEQKQEKATSIMEEY